MILKPIPDHKKAPEDLIRPLTNSVQKQFAQSPAMQALELAGVVPSQLNTGAITETQKKLQSALDTNNASIDDAVRVIAHHMHYGETPAIRMRAAEKVIDLQTQQGKQNDSFVINIISGENIDLRAILNPVRE